MIRHTVLFNIKKSATAAEIDHAFNLLNQLKNVLPGFLRVASGKCTFHGGHDINESVYGFSIDFADESAYNAFLTDPASNPAKGSILQITEGGMSGIYGYDMGRYLGPTYNPSPLDKYKAPVPRLLPRGFK